MQDLLKNILRKETETAQAAWELLKTLPDYRPGPAGAGESDGDHPGPGGFSHLQCLGERLVSLLLL